jgi:hypothetical protein
LAEQAIGVLIRPALPGAGRITKVDGYESALGEVLVARHSRALIPGEGPAQMGREDAHRCFQPVAQVLRSAVARQVHEEDELRGPFNQRANGRS